MRHRSTGLSLALALSGILVLGSSCAMNSGGAEKEELDLASAIDRTLAAASADGSGYAIVVEIDGEVVLNKGYGYANRDAGSPFTPDTIGQIGSLTKQFNATAILQLAESGAVDLSAPINTYIPTLELPVGSISVHQLLTHRSGLPEYCGDDFDRLSRDDFIRRCLKPPLLFEPGTDTAYSNVGYSVIAAIVEFVSGQKFETYIDEAILRPNGLEATGHHFPGFSAANLARGYLNRRDMGNIAGNIRSLGDSWWNLKGNGGMQASALDMYAWHQVLNGGGTLSDSVRAELTQPHSPWVDGVATGYGWYFRSDDRGLVRQMSHSGSDGVFFSYYRHRLDQRAFLYFVGNSGEDPTKDVLRDILSLLSFGLEKSR